MRARPAAAFQPDVAAAMRARPAAAFQPDVTASSGHASLSVLRRVSAQRFADAAPAELAHRDCNLFYF